MKRELLMNDNKSGNQGDPVSGVEDAGAPPVHRGSSDDCSKQIKLVISPHK